MTATDTFRVVHTYPHDPTAFTQGLIFRDGFLFESTGLIGQSTLRQVDLDTGMIVQEHRLSQMHFAEGLTEWQGRLVQLTWRSNIAFVYDVDTFAQLTTFTYVGQGWGLTHDAGALILSDGSERLRFLDPDTFREVRTVSVMDHGVPVRLLNELEYVDNELYANVWGSERVARIAPHSGQVLGWIDLRGLMPSGSNLKPDAMLNGIAYDPTDKRLFVTGKLWPKLFEVEIIQQR